LPAWLATTMQVPGLCRATTAPPPTCLAVHTDGVDVEKLTVRPEEADACTISGGWARERCLTRSVKVMVWLALLTVTVIDCWTWGAAFQLVLPAWLASTTQVPAPAKLTTPAEIEHAPEVLEPSIVKLTVRPEVAVAVGV